MIPPFSYFSAFGEKIITCYLPLMIKFENFEFILKIKDSNFVGIGEDM